MLFGSPSIDEREAQVLDQVDQLRKRLPAYGQLTDDVN